MRFLALILLLSFAPEPSITSDKPGFDRAETGAPTALGRRLTVRNPTRHARVVTIRCGLDRRTDVQVLLRPKASAVVDVGTGHGLVAGECYVLSIGAP